MRITRIGQHIGMILSLLLSRKLGEPSFQVTTCRLVDFPEADSLRSGMGSEHLSTQIQREMGVYLPFGHGLQPKLRKQIQKTRVKGTQIALNGFVLQVLAVQDRDKKDEMIVPGAPT